MNVATAVPLPLAKVPSELREVPQWVLWKLEEVDGRKTKVPYTIGGSKASTTNPTTWGAFNNALEVLNGFDEYAGIGFVFVPPFVGVDLDKCRDPETGIVKPWAIDAITMLDSYTEYSPSKTGFHILLKGDLPAAGNRKGPVEIYTKARYFTVTGDHVPGTPTTVNSRDLKDFHKKFIRSSSGNYSTPKDSSLSAVEFKLACEIARELGPNCTPEDVKLEFFKRADYRDKWAGHATYIDRTIKVAIEKVYVAATTSPKVSAPAVSTTEEEDEPEIVEEPLPEFPVVPGTIGELSDALCPDVPREFKIMALVTRAGLMLSGRVKLEGETHLQPRFYTCMIAPPHAGKTAANNEVERLFLPKHDYLSVTSIDSGPALVDTFQEISEKYALYDARGERAARLLLNPDELRDLFEKAKASKESRNSIGSELLKLFEANNTGNRSRQNGVKEISNAHLAIIGGAPPQVYEEMWNSTGGAASGLQSRFTLVTTDKKMPEVQAKWSAEEVAEISGKLRKQMENPPQEIRTSPEALTLFREWWRSTPRDRQSEARIADLVKRFLMVLVVTNGMDTIEPWIMKVGIAFGNYQIALREKFNPDDASGWVQGFEQRMLKAYRKHGELTERQLRRLISPEKHKGGFGPYLQATKNLGLAGVVVKTGEVGGKRKAAKFGLSDGRKEQ